MIYIISGKAEQWVGQQKKLLGPGDMAFIPMGEIHGT
jgi:quercetin dioxygenase-like cupin family protein